MALTLLKTSGEIVSLEGMRVIWMVKLDPVEEWKRQTEFHPDVPGLNHQTLFEKTDNCDVEPTLETKFVELFGVPFSKDLALSVDDPSDGEDVTYYLPNGVEVVRCPQFDSIVRHIPVEILNRRPVWRLMVQWGNPDQGNYGLLHEDTEQNVIAAIQTAIFQAMSSGSNTLNLGKVIKKIDR